MDWLKKRLTLRNVFYAAAALGAAAYVQYDMTGDLVRAAVGNSDALTWSLSLGSESYYEACRIHHTLGNNGLSGFFQYKLLNLATHVPNAFMSIPGHMMELIPADKLSQLGIQASDWNMDISSETYQSLTKDFETICRDQTYLQKLLGTLDYLKGWAPLLLILLGSAQPVAETAAQYASVDITPNVA